MKFNIFDNVPGGSLRTPEEFIDGIILVPVDGDTPEVTAAEHLPVFFAIFHLIGAIKQSRIKGKPKQVVHDLKKKWDKLEKPIDNPLTPKDKFSRWNINDRIVIKEALMNLYIQLNEYPYGTVSPEGKQLIVNKIHSDNYEPNVIPKETQAGIVLEIFKYTDYENEEGVKYSNPGYDKYIDREVKRGERTFNKALDNIIRDRDRLFKTGIKK